MQRCEWVNRDVLYQHYHDNEWGRPEYNSQKLFEQLCLEGQQAGLSWITVLKKREHYRQAFHSFEPQKIALMTEAEIEALMQHRGLIRHKAKLMAIVRNAKAYLAMQEKGEDFSHFIWQFVDGTPKNNTFFHLSEIPTHTAVSHAMSKALKKRGFVFVGATICYAFMQSMGLVNDHLESCFCKHNEKTVAEATAK